MLADQTNDLTEKRSVTLQTEQFFPVLTCEGRVYPSWWSLQWSLRGRFGWQHGRLKRGTEDSKFGTREDGSCIQVRHDTKFRYDLLLTFSTDMVTHGGYFYLSIAIGAFDGRQEGSRHPRHGCSHRTFPVAQVLHPRPVNLEARQACRQPSFTLSAGRASRGSCKSDCELLSRCWKPRPKSNLWQIKR